MSAQFGKGEGVDPKGSAASSWPWPDSLDAVIAAPRHHTLLLENDRVRVLDTRIYAGDTTPIHTHRWPSVYYVIRWGEFVRRDGDGKIIVDTRAAAPNSEPPSALWTPPLPPHSLENVGRSEIHVVSIELKGAGK